MSPPAGKLLRAQTRPPERAFDTPPRPQGARCFLRGRPHRLQFELTDRNSGLSILRELTLKLSALGVVDRAQILAQNVESETG